MLRLSKSKYTPSKNVHLVESNWHNSQLPIDERKSKYDSFTPRKKYMKDMESCQSAHFTFQQDPPTLKTKFSDYKMRNQPLLNENDYFDSKKQLYQSLASGLDKQNIFKPFNEKKQLSTASPLKHSRNDVTRSNNYNSLKNNKYKYVEAQPLIQKKLNFEQKANYYQDRFNSFEKQPQKRKSIIKIRQQECKEVPLTPRRQSRLAQQISYDLIQKSQMIRNKLERLKRMTPGKKSVTPRKHKQEDAQTQREMMVQHQSIEYEDYYRECRNYEEELPPNSVRSRASQKQNQIMSKSKLQRLQQKRQEYFENEIDVIQDLSHRISSKLQSIIRNYS